MANRPRGFGMTAELNKKKDAKYDEGLAKESMEWVSLVLAHGGVDGQKVADLAAMETLSQNDIKDVLKDGVLLCKLVNIIVSDEPVKKINSSTMAFKQMENVDKFLKACIAIGCEKGDLFQTVDLYEGQNIPQVINGIMTLGRKAQTIGYDGPCLGPKESTENKREFTEEQLSEGKNIIGLQAGSNKGASQAGQNFGGPRQVMEQTKKE